MRETLVADNKIQRNLCLLFIYIVKNDPIIPCSIFILTFCQNVMILLWCNVNDD